jgi:hypothetical protein
MDRKILKNILRILTLTCDQSAQLMSKSQEATLSRAERWALGFHLLVCRSCRKYKKQLKTLRATLKKIAQPHIWDTAAPPLLDDEQARALQKRISKRIQENLDSM